MKVLTDKDKRRLRREREEAIKKFKQYAVPDRKRKWINSEHEVYYDDYDE